MNVVLLLISTWGPWSFRWAVGTPTNLPTLKNKLCDSQSVSRGRQIHIWHSVMGRLIDLCGWLKPCRHLTDQYNDSRLPSPTILFTNGEWTSANFHRCLLQPGGMSIMTYGDERDPHLHSSREVIYILTLFMRKPSFTVFPCGSLRSRKSPSENSAALLPLESLLLSSACDAPLRLRCAYRKSNANHPHIQPSEIHIFSIFLYRLCYTSTTRYSLSEEFVHPLTL